MLKNMLFLGLGSILLLTCTRRDADPFSPMLMSYCRSLPQAFMQVPDSTARKLEEAGSYISRQLKSGEEASICFVCEHNSRKSHLGQVWTHMAAQYYRIDHVKTYSGGTNPTYVNQRIVRSLENAGFQITQKGMAGQGPIYHLDPGKASAGFEIFSKRYDHSLNPDTNYLAISLCYDPEECCPISHGADLQLAIPYEDLQPFDNTDLEPEMYDEQCLAVARDMFYMMDFVRRNRVPGAR